MIDIRHGTGSGDTVVGTVRAGTEIVSAFQNGEIDFGLTFGRTVFLEVVVKIGNASSVFAAGSGIIIQVRIMFPGFWNQMFVCVGIVVPGLDFRHIVHFCVCNVVGLLPPGTALLNGDLGAVQIRKVICRIQHHGPQRRGVWHETVMFVSEITAPDRKIALLVDPAAERHAEVQMGEGKSLHVGNDVRAAAGNFKIQMEGGTGHKKFLPAVFFPDTEIFFDVGSERICGIRQRELFICRDPCFAEAGPERKCFSRIVAKEHGVRYDFFCPFRRGIRVNGIDMETAFFRFGDELVEACTHPCIFEFLTGREIIGREIFSVFPVGIRHLDPGTFQIQQICHTFQLPFTCTAVPEHHDIALIVINDPVEIPFRIVIFGNPACVIKTGGLEYIIASVEVNGDTDIHAAIGQFHFFSHADTFLVGG